MDYPACIYGPPEMLFKRKQAAEKALRTTVEVVAAVILDDGKILATQRGYGKWRGWWEFPGGKMQEGESREEALLRELKEEMDAAIVIDEYYTTVEYDYPDFHLTMHCYLCHLADGFFKLKEHEDARWLAPDQFDSVQWLPADTGLLQQLSTRLTPDCQPDED